MVRAAVAKTRRCADRWLQKREFNLGNVSKIDSSRSVPDGVFYVPKLQMTAELS